MKRLNNVFDKIVDMDNLKLAHKKAREDKAYYKEVKMVDNNPEYYLSKIRYMLIKGEYKVSDYDVSTINDSGKERELMKLPYYPDRIIQWAIMLQIEETFRKTFVYHTCASIPDRGIKRAYLLTRKYLKDTKGCRFCLKLDVSKFYPNINHEVLKNLLRRKFKDSKLLSLLDVIIDSYPGEKGVPIGSYLSQYFANFYLSYFDHWLKEIKKVKYIVRYMDDIIILHNAIEFLHKLRNSISEYLGEFLLLTLKPNYQVFPTNIRGIDFVGYRFFYKFTLLRKTTCKRFKKTMLEILNKKVLRKNLLNYSEWCSVNSYSGYLRWCNSNRLWIKYLKPAVSSAVKYYHLVICKNHKPKAQIIKFENYKSKLYKDRRWAA